MIPVVVVSTRRVTLRAEAGRTHWTVTADRGTFRAQLAMPPLDEQGVCGCVGIVPCDLGCTHTWGPRAHRPGRESMSGPDRQHRRDFCHHFHAGTVRALLTVWAKTYGHRYRQTSAVGVPRPTKGLVGSAR